MNPHKCTFRVSADKFLGFIIDGHGIEVDLDRIIAIRKVRAATCKLEMQSFLDKVNYLRRFISNVARKINALTHILWIKNNVDFTWGKSNNRHLILSRITYIWFQC
jgi:hypothetical protein